MRLFPVSLLVIMITALLLPGNPSADVSTAQVKSEDPLFAVLLGGNEVGSDGKASAGDLNGKGSATILVDSGRGMLCFGITVSGLGSPVAAHIHRAATGVNGNIVVPLVPPTTGNPGSSSGCVSGVSRGLLTSIKNGPTGFYVNVHTTEFPGGAVRGQLF
jgi:hypothetical protein